MIADAERAEELEALLEEVESPAKGGGLRRRT
jgi:hypothetical protein